MYNTGALDSIAYPKGSEYLLANTKTDKKDKSYFVYENSHHEIFHEKHPIKQDSIVKVVDYFESQMYFELVV
jgi:esterase/lipase